MAGVMRLCVGIATLLVAEGSSPSYDEDHGDVDRALMLRAVEGSGAEKVVDNTVPTATGRIYSPWIVETTEALQGELIAAEAALSLRAEVDGPVVVYDSPSVSVALRKVSPETLANEWIDVKTSDGATVSIPPGAKQRHGGPVVISITSYHTGGRIKELPGGGSGKVKFGTGREYRRKLGGEESLMTGSEQKEDRVDFFHSRAPSAENAGRARHNVQWSGTVNVRVRDKTKGLDRKMVKNGMDHGLGISVPAHEVWVPPHDAGSEFVKYPTEKKMLQMEVERITQCPKSEWHREYRRLAKIWHPDKNPGDKEKATALFSFLAELKATLLDDPG